MEHIGSVVLIQMGGKRYIVTASHVIDEHIEATLAISIDQKIRILEGDFYQTSKVDGERKNDRYDFAWRNISKDLSDVPEENFYLGSTSFNQIDDAGQTYTILGYPNSKNKPKHSTKQIIPKSFAFTNLGKHNGDFIHLKHEDTKCRNSDGKIVTSPKIQGISGGALFGLGNLVDPNRLTTSPSGILAGIVTEKQKGTSEIISTKINVILDAIRK